MGIWDNPLLWNCISYSNLFVFNGFDSEILNIHALYCDLGLPFNMTRALINTSLTLKISWYSGSLGPVNTLTKAKLGLKLSWYSDH